VEERHQPMAVSYNNNPIVFGAARIVLASGVSLRVNTYSGMDFRLIGESRRQLICAPLVGLNTSCGPTNEADIGA
jgi:hypothetical protein